MDKFAEPDHKFLAGNVRWQIEQEGNVASMSATAHDDETDVGRAFRDGGADSLTCVTGG